MDYQISFNATTKVATVQAAGAAVPSGSTNVGTFSHADDEDLLGNPAAGNHVIYHHVQEALYHVGQLDMQVVRIDATVDVNPIPVASVEVTPVTASIVVGGTQQLTANVMPANATDKTVTYASDTPAIATVSGTGLVTAVAAGTAVITVTTTDGTFTDTSTITVTAA